MPLSPCPPLTDLQAFLDGQLTDPRAQTVDDHVGACGPCQTRLKFLTRRDSLPELDDALRAVIGAKPVVSVPQLPDIELFEEVGRGGAGRVWKGRLKQVGQLVAVKVLTGGAHADARQQERFLREAEILSRLRHPGLIRLYHFGLTTDGYFFSMEYLPAGSLADDRERRGRELTPVRRSAEVAHAVAMAVHHAHELHVVHRDLKPGNVLLTADGRPVVADFGAARFTSGPDTTGGAVGTPCYMAPEQGTGKLADVRSDVYGIGAILYDLLTGRPPVAPGESELETLGRVQHEHPIPPRRLRPDVPADLERVCLKCLEKDPRHRYPSAAALADDLGRFLDGTPVHARPVRWPYRFCRTIRRHPAVAGLTAALALTLAVTLVVIIHLWLAAERRLALAREVTVRNTQAVLRTARAGEMTTAADRVAVIEAVEAQLRLLAEGDDQPETERDLAWGLLQLGQRLQDQGEFTAANRAVAVAVESLSRLVRKSPERDDWVHDLAQAEGLYATICYKIDRIEDWIQTFRTAEARMTDLLSRRPQSDVYRATLASVRWHLGAALAFHRRWPEAEEAYRAALPDTDALLTRHPGDALRYAEHDQVIRGLGEVLLRRDGRPDRCIELYRTWADRLEQVRASRADWHRLSRPYFTHNGLSSLLRRAGRVEESDAAGVMVIDSCRAAYVADPNPVYQVWLALYLLDSSVVHWPSDAARAQCDESVRLFQQLVPHLSQRDQLRAYSQFLAECPDPAHRDPQQAVQLARRVVDLDPADPVARVWLIERLAAAGRDAEVVSEADRWLTNNRPPEGHLLRAYLAATAARWHLGQRDRARADLRRLSARLMQEWIVGHHTWAVHDATWRLIEGTDPPRTLPDPER